MSNREYNEIHRTDFILEGGFRSARCRGPRQK